MNGSEGLNLRKITAGFLAVYLVLTVCFYFLAGDQLRYRESRGDLEPLEGLYGVPQAVLDEVNL